MQLFVDLLQKYFYLYYCNISSIVITLLYLILKTMSVIINSFSLSVDGLTISYTFSGQSITAKYDPLSACDLMKGAGLIEDFAADSNGEPVILFSDNNHPIGYGYELWCYFVKSFFISERVAEMLVEWRERRKNIARFIGRINYMLYPAIKATA